jgi:hypothetical protein
MATQFDSGYASLLFASTVTANSIVSMTTTDNTAQTAATAGNAIGVLQQDVVNGSVGLVKLFQPSNFARSASLVTAGSLVYQAINGQVSTSTAGGAITAGVVRNAGASGDTIEVFYTR